MTSNWFPFKGLELNDQARWDNYSSYVVTTTDIYPKVFGYDFSSVSGFTVVQSIQLPDGTNYSFKYACDSSVNSAVCSSRPARALIAYRDF